ncbi:MAG: ABC transporter permease [Candidatus Nanoarchaeia archaeon]|nr:ABC transporter permease [Candidatus Nanoarchaeia archaeon]MDD5238946.1 ABC transporter permease [Candidatus Nanoarchaeia archaeon]
MRTAKLLASELNKNFRLLFRNWTAVALLIVAPLLLIMLVGYSFSGTDLHDINIGYISNETSSINAFLANITDFAVPVKYASAEVCLSDMRLEKVHLCLAFSGTFVTATPGDFPNGDVTFYFDNSRKSLATAIVSHVKEFFGLQAEQISMISAQTIIVNVQNLLDFISGRVSEVDAIKEQADAIRADMIQRKAELVQVRADYLPKYQIAKDLQSTLSNYTEIMNSSKTALDNQTATMRVLLKDTETLISQLNSIVAIPAVYTALNGTTYNLSDICNLSLDSNITQFYNLTEICNSSYNITFPVYYPILTGLSNTTFAAMYAELDVMSNTTNTTYSQIMQLKTDYDSTVEQLDDIKTLLDEEINRSDYYIALIDQSIVQIDALSASLDEKMSSLTSLDPALAAKIVKPITQQFIELITGIKNEQLAFPMLLSVIVIFISLLFSNVVTLLEIHNKAYMRNIIAPVNDMVFTAGLALTNFIVVAFQIIVLFFVAQFLFRLDVLGNISALLPITALLAAIFIFAGMTIAYLSKTNQSSILLTTFIALAFFLFSNTINSLEAMPKLAAAVAQFNPVVIANSALKKILIYNLPITFSLPETAMLLLYAAVALAALIIVSKIKNKQRF